MEGDMVMGRRHGEGRGRDIVREGYCEGEGRGGDKVREGQDENMMRGRGGLTCQSAPKHRRDLLQSPVL